MHVHVIVSVVCRCEHVVLCPWAASGHHDSTGMLGGNDWTIYFGVFDVPLSVLCALCHVIVCRVCLCLGELIVHVSLKGTDVKEHRNANAGKLDGILYTSLHSLAPLNTHVAQS
jgi:hypothetical protein